MKFFAYHVVCICFVMNYEGRLVYYSGLIFFLRVALPRNYSVFFSSDVQWLYFCLAGQRLIEPSDFKFSFLIFKRVKRLGLTERLMIRSVLTT